MVVIFIDNLKKSVEFNMKYFWFVDVDIRLFEVYRGDVWFFIIDDGDVI